MHETLRVANRSLISSFSRLLIRARAVLLVAFLLPALLAGPALVGCSAVFVSAYDEKTDEGVTSLQKDVDSLMGELSKSPLPQYPAVKPSYDTVRANLDTLRVRNELRSKNSLTLEQLQHFKEAFDRLETQHKNGSLNEHMLRPAQESLDQICRAILKLELEKKEPQS